MAEDINTDGSPASTNEAIDEIEDRLEDLEVSGPGGDSFVEDPVGSGLYRMVTSNG